MGRLHKLAGSTSPMSDYCAYYYASLSQRKRYGHRRVAVVGSMLQLPLSCACRATYVELDGHSILPIIHPADATSPHTVLHFQWQNKWAVREENWKLIARRSNSPTAGTSYSLYHLGDERPEVRDYASDQPELVEKLRALHDEWEREVRQ